MPPTDAVAGNRSAASCFLGSKTCLVFWIVTGSPSLVGLTTRFDADAKSHCPPKKDASSCPQTQTLPSESLARKLKPPLLSSRIPAHAPLALESSGVCFVGEASKVEVISTG